MPHYRAGTADILLAFEKLEALRWIHYLRPGGNVIVNTREIYPLPVLAGGEEYPGGIIESISGKAEDVTTVDAFSLAVKSGSEKTLNTVLLGILAAKSGLDERIWKEAVSETVPKKTIAINLTAFETGFNLVTNP